MPVLARSSPLSQEALAEVARRLDEIGEGPTTARSARERLRVLHELILYILREGGPSCLEDWAPREEVVAIERKVREGADDAPAAVDGLLRKAREAFPGAGAASGVREIDLVNPTSGARLWARVYTPETLESGKRYPAFVIVPGGLGFGSSMGRGPITPRFFAEHGFVVGVFDPDGRGQSEGDEDWNGKVHQDALNAFLKGIARLEFVDAENLGVYSMSYGLAMAAGALGRYPDDPPVRWFADWEGPTDRFFITKNDDEKFTRVMGGHATDEAEWWAEREAVRTIRTAKVRYLRLQSESDHVHKEVKQHALDIIEASTSREHGGLGSCAWTRVNGPENPENTVFTAEEPPKWLSSKRVPIPPETILEYIREMAGLR